MATISTCDRCLRNLNEQGRWIKLKPGTVITSIPMQHSEMVKVPDFDLCGDCYEVIVSNIKAYANAGKVK
jgi:hypothetical protein